MSVVNTITTLDTKPCLVSITLENVDIDTGACKNILPCNAYSALTGVKRLQPAVENLIAASGTHLHVVCKIHLNVHIGSQLLDMPFFVVQNELKYIILGRTGLNMM